MPHHLWLDLGLIPFLHFHMRAMHDMMHANGGIHTGEVGKFSCECFEEIFFRRKIFLRRSFRGKIYFSVRKFWRSFFSDLAKIFLAVFNTFT